MNDENKIIKAIYALALGVFLAVFIGVGINTFYAPQKPFEYSKYSTPIVDGDTTLPDNNSNRYDSQLKIYNEREKVYSRNVSIASLVASTVLVIISIRFEKKLHTLADGIMFGGLITLGYATIRSFMSSSSKFEFVSISVSLLLVLFVGYHKFVKRPIVSKKKA